LFVIRGARLALDTGEPYRVARALTAATVLHASLGRAGRARTLLAATERAAMQDDSPGARFYALCARHVVEFLLDNHWRAALEGLRQAETMWRDLGHAQGWEIDVVEQFGFWALDNMGRLRTLARRVPARIRAAQLAGNRFVETNYRVFFTGLALAGDAPAEARHDVKDAIAAWLPGQADFGNQHYLATRSLTHIALYDGSAESEAADLDARWKRYDGSLLARVQFLQQDALWMRAGWSLARALAARARGEATVERAHLDAARRYRVGLARLDLPMAHAAGARLDAGIAAVEGDEARAVARLRDAIVLADAQETELYAACLRWRLGRVVGGSEGDLLVKTAESWLGERGVRVPERMAAAHVPGWR
jgi:hypothetical protein